MKSKIDINCDLGESYGAFKIGDDAEVMPFITSANVACGFHGGDPTTIAETVSLAKRHKVAVGAHPSHPDLMGFGRREMQLTMEEARNYTIYQVSALQGFASTAGLELQHVKPHGALYNSAARDESLSEAIIDAIRALDSNLVIFAQPRSVSANVAAKKGLRVAHEFFADRAYNPDGSLVSRKHADALVQEPKRVVARVIQAANEGTVLTTSGRVIDVGEIHTVCVHGDTPSAAELVQFLRSGLDKAGIDVQSVGSFI